MNESLKIYKIMLASSVGETEPDILRRMSEIP